MAVWLRAVAGFILIVVVIFLWLLVFEGEPWKRAATPAPEPAPTSAENTVVVDTDIDPSLSLPVADRIRIVIACNNGGGFEFSADNVRSGISFDWPGCAIAEPLQVGLRATFGASAVEEE